MNFQKLRIQHQKWPSVDARHMMRCEDAEPRIADVVCFTRLSEASRFGEMAPVVAPQFDVVPRVLPLFGPGVDIDARSPRLKLHGHEHRIRRAPAMISSVLTHVVIAAIWTLSLEAGGFLRNKLVDENSVVEVSFGMAIQQQQTAPTQLNVGESQLDVEATKKESLLPQLTKSVAVEGQEKLPDSMPLPAQSPTAVPKQTPNPTPQPVVEATKPPGTKTLKVEDILRRMEREKRVVGAKEKEGTHQKGGKGVKDALSALPADPFATSGSVRSQVGVGSLDGRMSPSASAYQAMALNHLKRHWSLSDFQEYRPELLCRVEVQLNMFGKIQNVSVLSSSGNDNFDQEVIAAVRSADPFPDFSDEKIPRRILVLSFRPREVK
jgi:TonB family protein